MAAAQPRSSNTTTTAGPFAALLMLLQEAETRLVRENYRFIPITELSFLDDRGMVALPRGQRVTLRVIQTAGQVVVLHTCVIATFAEIDWLLRACHFYSARGSAMVEVRPMLITLSIYPAERRMAENSGIHVYLHEASPSGAGGHILRSSSVLAPPPSYILGSLSSTQIETEPLPPADVDTSKPTPPLNSKSAGALKAWQTYLTSSGAVDAASVAFLAEAFVRNGIELPPNPANLPWEKMKDIEGVKLGQLTRLKKFASTGVATTSARP